jgi:integrase
MSERISFTRRRLDDAKCPEGKDRGWLYDTEEPGLCLLVTAAGAKSFYLYRKIDGRPERIRLGTYPDLSIDDARDAARIKKGDIAKGINPAQEKRAARGAMTLAELLTHFLDTFAKSHKKRWADDVAMFNRYFGKPESDRTPKDKPASFPAWRNRTVNTITQHDVKVLHTKVGEKHGKYAANRLLALLSAMFNNAGLANPTKGVKKFREQQRERFMDADEFPRFHKALDDEPDQDMADYFRLLLYTMQRRSNVAAMRWADVNFGKREWSLPGQTTKNGDPLTVSLTDEAMGILQRRWNGRRDGAVFVFASFGASGHLTEPKGAWKRILGRANITDFRIHDLRHTGASWMAINNTSLPIIGKALGHKSQQSTARYAHVNRSAAAQAAQTATAMMAGFAAPVVVKKQGKGKSKKSA